MFELLISFLLLDFFMTSIEINLTLLEAEVLQFFKKKDSLSNLMEWFLG
jgi:hypothetical protein